MATTPCPLTTNMAYDPCIDKAPGGIKSVRFIEKAYLAEASITIVSGVVTAMTPSSSKKFWKYTLAPQNKDYFKSDIQADPTGGWIFWKPEIQMTLHRMTATKRNEIKLLATNLLIAIVENNDGTFWMTGYKNGLDIMTSTGDSGAGRGTFGGYVLKFSGEEDDDAVAVDPTIIDTNTH